MSSFQMKGSLTRTTYHLITLLQLSASQRPTPTGQLLKPHRRLCEGENRRDILSLNFLKRETQTKLRERPIFQGGGWGNDLSLKQTCIRIYRLFNAGGGWGAKERNLCAMPATAPSVLPHSQAFNPTL